MRPSKVFSALVFLIVSSAVPFGAYGEDLDLCMRGWANTQEGNHFRALELFEECIKKGQLSKASLARTYRNIGITYRLAKKPSYAVEAFTKAIELNPKDVWDDHVNRGNAYDDEGKIEAAMAEYDKALKLNPGYGEAYYNRGIAYEGQHQYEKAKVEFINAYEHGLRTSLLYDRMVAHGLVKKEK